ncbi:hypothetical protein Poli38472_013809 [Pythium oligandrum]|uniref:Uncharacterized protein n=1 Tax=Pythium oligandrum TaxID=41045 RepID=A0A8K1C2N5_PYTOL|nr:hypothetical protein Poli38472_013809 [Pythium oligandrum]|eukprot:TMW55047.1 hypothetical protein Poli38472_013809 [Pythium oligandrum]
MILISRIIHQVSSTLRGLRKEKENAIVKRWKNTDPYHAAPLPKKGYAMQLDHIVEKQCFSYGLTLLKHHNDEEAVETAIGALHSIVHSRKNLCFTLATTNVIKGQACTAYLEDSLMKLVVPEYTVQPFTDYLLAKEKDGSRLERGDTRRIRKTMGRAVKSCQRKLDGQGDTPVLGRLSKELGNLYADMELHVPAVD